MNTKNTFKGNNNDLLSTISAPLLELIERMNEDTGIYDDDVCIIVSRISSLSNGI